MISLTPTFIAAQCGLDMVGCWSNSSNSILIEVEPRKDEWRLFGGCIVSNEKNEYKGAIYGGNRRQITIEIYQATDRITGETTNLNKTLEFAILDASKQELVLRAMSDDAINLWGKNQIRLYNSEFVKFEDLKIDYIIFSRFGEKYTLRLDNGLIYKRISRYRKRGREYIFYKGEISNEFCENMIQEIKRSSILYLSPCEFESGWSHTSYANITIYYNDNRYRYFSQGHNDRVSNLIYHLRYSEIDVKWRRTNRIAVLNPLK